MIVTSTHLSNLMKTKRKCREISFPFLGWFDGASSLYFPLILKVVLYVLLYIQDIFVYVCMYVYMEGMFMLHWVTRVYRL